MFGCESRAAVSASQSSRSSRTVRLAPARTALKATSRPSSRSRASYTTPKPPCPTSRSSSNRPMTAPGSSAVGQPVPCAGSGWRPTSSSTSDSAPGRIPSATAVAALRVLVRVSSPALRLTAAPPRAPSSLLLLQHLHGRRQAAMHPVERGGKDRDLVASLHRQLWHLHLPLADLVRAPGEVADGADHGKVEEDIEHQQGHEADGNQRDQEPTERAIRHLHRQGYGDGDDLRRDDLVLPPAESVRRTIELHHVLRRFARRRMTLETGLGGPHGPREEQRFAERRHALAVEQRQVGTIAEDVEDVLFPIDDAIAWVGGVERGFLVEVVGVLLAQVVEDLGGGKRRDRLGTEDAPRCRFPGADPADRVDRFRIVRLGDLVHHRPDLLGGVVAHCKRCFHHDLRFMEDLLACAPLQRVVKEEGRGSETEAEHDRENQTELRQQAHGRPPRPTRRGTLARWEKSGGKGAKTRRRNMKYALDPPAMAIEASSSELERFRKAAVRAGPAAPARGAAGSSAFADERLARPLNKGPVRCSAWLPAGELPWSSARLRDPEQTP